MKPQKFWWGTKKFWINTTWICILILSPWVNATPSDWNIFPSTCITDKPGELCRLEITVEFPKSFQKNEPDKHMQKVCFELKGEILDCVLSSHSPAKLTLEIPKTSILKVLVDEQLVLEKEIVVQSLTPKKRRRRVRNPWSFF